jgi:anti-sigma regulatory factor (Ser/Thr protein kinase)
VEEASFQVSGTPRGGPALAATLAARRPPVLLIAALVPAQRDSRPAVHFGSVAGPDQGGRGLGSPPDDAQVLRYRADLGSVRAFTAAAARQAGLLPRRATDFVLAVSELAANTFAHTKGPGTLFLWITEHELIGQIRDTGHITSPDPGQARPDTAGHGGYGLWLVRQLCDRVQIRTGPGGTLIEIRMSLLPAPTA